MAQNSNVYVVVDESEYYGPVIIRSVVVGEDGAPVVYDSQEDAEAAAETYDPQYVPSLGGCLLSHNQYSASHGLVAELVTDRFDAYTWDSFECNAPDLWDAAAAYEDSGMDANEALSHAIDECDYVVSPDGRSLYRLL